MMQSVDTFSPDAAQSVKVVPHRASVLVVLYTGTGRRAALTQRVGVCQERRDMLSSSRTLMTHQASYFNTSQVAGLNLAAVASESCTRRHVYWDIVNNVTTGNTS